MGIPSSGSCHLIPLTPRNEDVCLRHGREPGGNLLGKRQLNGFDLEHCLDELAALKMNTV